MPALILPGCSYDTSSTVACAWSSKGKTRNVLAAYETFVRVTLRVYFLPTTKSSNATTRGEGANASPSKTRPHVTCFR